MALTISQLVAISFPEVLNTNRTPENQWAENAFLREAERQGMIEYRDLGEHIEATLDYQSNPATVVQATDLQPLSLTKTEVLTAASYDVAEIVAPFTWSRKDEVRNPTKNQKVRFTAALIENAIQSHDDKLEQAIFATSTNGLLGLNTHATTAGTGSDGGIDSGTNTFWRNQQQTYIDDTDIESGATVLYNQCAKGSGSKMVPTFGASDATTQALFEGTQQAFQRWVDTDELKAGFRTIGFKTIRWIFSQYGNTKVYFLNPKNFKIVVSRGNFRDRDETIPLQDATGWTSRVYSALQTIVNNRSRIGVLHT